MGLEKTFYSVSESVGVIEVCAIVYSPTIDCPIAFPFDVSLSTSDNTAGIVYIHEDDCFFLPNDINYLVCITESIRIVPIHLLTLLVQNS